MSTASQLRRRSKILGTQAFTRGTVKRLGLVAQLWVDPQALKVVGFEIRSASEKSAIASVPFSQVTLLGTGAVLVEASALSDPLKTDALSKLVGQPLATADGVALGKIKGFEFDAESGEIARLSLSATGLPLLPPALETTFQIDRADLVAGERLEAIEGAQQRVSLVKRGLLERIGLGKFAWADELTEAGISIVPQPSSESETPESETPEPAISEPEPQDEAAEANVSVAKTDDAETISSEVRDTTAAPTEPESDTEIELESGVEPEPETESETETESKPDAELASDLESEPDAAAIASQASISDTTESEAEISKTLDSAAPDESVPEPAIAAVSTASIAAAAHSIAPHFTTPIAIEPATAEQKTTPRPKKPLSHPPLPPDRSISLPSSANFPPKAGGFSQVQVKGR